MGPRPVIFVSAVTQELKSARDLVAKTLLRLGYEADWEDLFGTGHGELPQIIRGKIDRSAGLLQLIGQRYGTDTPAPHEPFGRVSYTQYEAHYARQQGKKVWYLFLGDTYPTDPTTPEPDELAALQRAYRERVAAGSELYHTVSSPAALEAAVLGMRDDLAILRAEWKKWTTDLQRSTSRQEKALAWLRSHGKLVVVLLILCAGLGVWMVPKLQELRKGQTRIEHLATDPAVLRARLEEKIEQTFEEKKAALLAAAAPPAEIDALYRWRDRAKGQIAEAVAFITARAADPASPIITRAAAILEERGVDATLEYLADTLTAERRRHKEEGRQLAEASLMKAGLHQSRLETAEQERALRDAIADAPDWWRPHNALGLLLHERAQWAAAEREYEAARRTMPAEAEAAVLNNLATLYQATNRLAQAEALLKQALHLDEKSYGSDHRNVARDLNNLAQVYQDTHRLAEAEPLMERALQICRKSFGPDHSKVATALNNLASLYVDTNRLPEAESLWLLALQIATKSLGPDHDATATILNNLGMLYQDTCRAMEAEELIEQSLQITEKCFGPEHPNVAVRLNNLAQLYQTTSRAAKAERLMERALRIDEKSFGPYHRDVAIDLNNLASLYKATNRLAKAEPLMKRALKIDEKSFGPEHLRVAAGLNNLARLYQETNRLAEAELLSRRHLVIFLKLTRKTGHLHPHLSAAIENYAHLLTEMGVAGAEIAGRLLEAGREAGFAPEEFKELYERVMR